MIQIIMFICVFNGLKLFEILPIKWWDLCPFVLIASTDRVCQN